MNTKIKAKILKYKWKYWGIFCGEATVKLLEGVNKGKTVTLPVTKHHKEGDIISIYEGD